MAPQSRLRRRTIAGLTAVLAVLLAACAPAHPNSIFHSHTDFNREVDHLWDLLIGLGSFVFLFVETLLLITLIKFRKREGQPAPTQVHGNRGRQRHQLDGSASCLDRLQMADNGRRNGINRLPLPCTV